MLWRLGLFVLDIRSTTAVRTHAARFGISITTTTRGGKSFERVRASFHTYTHLIFSDSGRMRAPGPVAPLSMELEAATRA